ncbi:serine/threonine-protein phosphatase 6 regulatory ankyrin repeat subunit B-like isoform X1 [Asterias rubens]|uniref:serine/threonine-protein phosphatase 6 regulatory ankyrin repeat subunit B-like isoform X1 n=1 Tax=Asterias rubens TaxID=7604 RepID=UPI001455C932|nr:serine/threonine-protein phosphatase 6 regulatory ankyrin repeat subunit B-like isoform X1 [Asterias rubens]
MRNADENLFKTVRFGNPENLEKLLNGNKKGHQNTVNTNSKSPKDGATPLIQCIQGAGRVGNNAWNTRTTNHLECGRLLLRHGANPDSRDKLGRTALHWAVFYKRVDFVETILDHKADPSLGDQKGQNVLDFAVRVNADTCFKLLCARVEKQVLEQCDADGTPLLVYATQLGHTEAVRILLECGVRPNSSNREGQTAAHIAVWGQRTDILKLLLRNGACSHLTDHSKVTVIAAASASHNPEILSLIVEEGDKINPEILDISDDDGVTPLMIAGRKGSYQIVEMLIDLGASLEATDKSGKTAMHHTIEHHHNDCVKMLIEADPSLAALTDSEGRNALHLATIDGDIELIQLVLPHVDINAMDNEQHSAIHWATVCGLYNCISLLIESGCTPATPDIHGAYPIHYATQMCGDPAMATAGLRCLQALLRKGGSSVNCVDKGGKTPLLWAASAGNIKACRLLVDLKADITLSDDNGLTALHCAVCRNHPSCLEALLRDCRCEPNPADKGGCTPLFYAITMDHGECALTLLKYGASPSWKDQDGKSPAFCAASRGSVPILKLLNNYGGSLQLRTISKDTPLTQAAKAQHIEAVSFLLKHGCKVNTRDGSGLTSMHHAATNNSVLLCTLLHQHEANINSVCVTKQGKPRTPLDCAEESNSRECVAYLLSLGAKHGSEIPEELWQSEEEEKDKEEDGRDASGEEIALHNLNEDEKHKKMDEEQNLGDDKEQDQERDETQEPPVKEEVEDEAKSKEGSSDQDLKTNEDRVARKKPQSKCKSGPNKTNAEELETKLANWNTYLQDNVEFLDVVINSQAQELSEARQKARSQKKELVGRLEELKTELERSCKRLYKDVEQNESKRESTQTDIAVVRRLHDIEERFQRANASAAASLDEFRASHFKVSDSGDREGENQASGDESIPDGNRFDSSQQNNEAWMEKKNKDHLQKTRIQQASSSMKLMNSPKMAGHRSRRHPKPMRRSHSIPDHRTVKSPYNAKVIIPLREPEPRRRRSNESQLSGHEEAQLRRRMGELNRAAMYPSASQMKIREYEGIYDLKEPCTPRWDGGGRPRCTLHFLTPEEFRKRVSYQKQPSFWL